MKKVKLSVDEAREIFNMLPAKKSMIKYCIPTLKHGELFFQLNHNMQWQSLQEIEIVSNW